ncbi:hypothetical protein [Planctomycetes bacterium TBK1r]|uniref:Manganese efflux pump MntP n=1 Tax=Stieleria magnilauensis TaxID=2527963 RepID=A0ABX5XHS3_9BACT|nr:manganese efflux pump MntP [Planctomycetes bacterium TBK1r]
MSWLSLALLAFGTSADAFVVSLARAVACSKVDRRAMTLAALTFGMTAVVATAIGITIAGCFEWMAISGCRGMGVVLIAILGTRCFRCGIV